MWHAGDWVATLESIGIKCNPSCSSSDKRTVAELVKNIRARYGNLAMVGHKDIVSTGCPGRYYPPSEVLAPYLGGTTPAPVQASSTPSGPSTNIQALAEAVIIHGEFGNGEERIKDLVRSIIRYKDE